MLVAACISFGLFLHMPSEGPRFPPTGTAIGGDRAGETARTKCPPDYRTVACRRVSLFRRSQ